MKNSPQLHPMNEGEGDSSAYTYADDTTSSISNRDIEIVKQKMEEDAVQILKFMASNGLIAYQSN